MSNLNPISNRPSTSPGDVPKFEEKKNDDRQMPIPKPPSSNKTPPLKKNRLNQDVNAPKKSSIVKRINFIFHRVNKLLEKTHDKLVVQPARSVGWLGDRPLEKNFGKHVVVALLQLSSVPIQIFNVANRSIQVVANIVSSISLTCFFRFGDAFKAAKNVVLNLREIMISPFMAIPGVRLFIEPTGQSDEDEDEVINKGEENISPVNPSTNDDESIKSNSRISDEDEDEVKNKGEENISPVNPSTNDDESIKSNSRKEGLVTVIKVNNEDVTVRFPATTQEGWKDCNEPTVHLNADNIELINEVRTTLGVRKDFSRDYILKGNRENQVELLIDQCKDVMKESSIDEETKNKMIEIALVGMYQEYDAPALQVMMNLPGEKSDKTKVDLRGIYFMRSYDEKPKEINISFENNKLDISVTNYLKCSLFEFPENTLFKTAFTRKYKVDQNLEVEHCGENWEHPKPELPQS